MSSQKTAILHCGMLITDWMLKAAVDFLRKRKVKLRKLRKIKQKLEINVNSRHSYYGFHLGWQTISSYMDRLKWTDGPGMVTMTFLVAITSPTVMPVTSGGGYFVVATSHRPIDSFLSHHPVYSLAAYPKAKGAVFLAHLLPWPL